MEKNNTEYKEAFEKGLMSVAHRQIDGNKYLVIPEGSRVEDMAAFEENPRRIKESETFIKVESFIEYLKTFQVDNTMVIADCMDHKVKATIDYHYKINPRWGDHTVYFDPFYSEDWKVWNEFNGHKFPQSEFLEFLEDHMGNIKTPPGAEIMELCQSLEGKKTVDWKSGIKQQDGAICLNWEEKFEEKGSSAGNLKIPPELVLNISPFEKGTPYEVRAFLRYRISAGNLVFFYKLVEPEKRVEDAFNGFLEMIKKDTKIAPLIGKI